MINVKKEELVFLEWLRNEFKQEGKLPKIDVMSLGVFKNYVREFCSSNSKDKDVEKKIVKSFKGKDPHRCIYDFEKHSFFMDEKDKRNFKFVSKRYLSNGSSYKCLIFPLERDFSKFKKLVTEYWSDLDALSADYLDIYYIFENYRYSGFKLMSEFESLDMRFHTYVPCIAIWEDKIDEAEAISINELSADDVFDVIKLCRL